MLKVIDRVPVIDAYSEAGLKPKSVTGHIDVQGVDFSYPARPDIQVRTALVAEECRLQSQR